MRTKSTMLHRTAGLVLLFAALVATEDPQKCQAAIMPPDGTYAGKNYGEWGAVSWQFSWSIPLDVQFYNDTTGAGAGLHQRGPVWFLWGASSRLPVTRTIRVADDIAFLVTLDGASCSNIEKPPFYGATEEEMRACALSFDPAPPTFELDGVSLLDLEHYYFVTPLFDFIAAAGTGVTPGPGQGVGASTTVLVEPLPPGLHTIHFTGGFQSNNSHWDVTYKITVVSRPALAVRPGKAANTVELSWPATPGFVLQETTTLGQNVSWVNASSVEASVVNGVAIANVTNAPASRLFRLVMP